MSAVEPCFVDTNVWLYAFIAGQDAAKHAQAQQLIQRPGIVVSVQVVNEVCVNLLRKASYPESELRKLIASFYARHQVASISEQVLVYASDLRDRYSLSYWDSVLVATAVESKVPILYTEDIQHGLAVEGITTIIIRLWQRLQQRHLRFRYLDVDAPQVTISSFRTNQRRPDHHCNAGFGRAHRALPWWLLYCHREKVCYRL